MKTQGSLKVIQCFTRSPKRAADHIDVVDVILDDAAPQPAAFILQRLRQIPVIERHVGRDPGFEQVVDQAAVKVQPGFVDRCRAPAGKCAARQSKAGRR